MILMNIGFSDISFLLNKLKKGYIANGIDTDTNYKVNILQFHWIHVIISTPCRLETFNLRIMPQKLSNKV